MTTCTKCPLPDEGRGLNLCFRHRLLTVGISGTALPSRYRGGFSDDPNQFDRDLAAYEKARRVGVQPEHSTEAASKRARKAAGDYEAL